MKMSEDLFCFFTRLVLREPIDPMALPHLFCVESVESLFRKQVFSDNDLVRKLIHPRITYHPEPFNPRSSPQLFSTFQRLGLAIHKVSPLLIPSRASLSYRHIQDVHPSLLNNQYQLNLLRSKFSARRPLLRLED